MAHDPTGMAGMEDPAKGLDEIISWVDDPGDVAKDDVAGIFPILNGKVLNVNMS